MNPIRPAFFLALVIFLICSGISTAQESPKQGNMIMPSQAAEETPPDRGDHKTTPEISEKIVTELRIVPFQKIQKADNTMTKGMVKVLQPGRQGRERVTYLIKTVDGRPAERTVLGTEVLSKPTPHVELIGTMPVISERTLTEVQTLPFQKEQKSDDTLPAGTIRVLQEGREGQERITFQVKIVDGKETERVVINSEVLLQPASRIEVLGTGKPVQEQ